MAEDCVRAGRAKVGGAAVGFAARRGGAQHVEGMEVPLALGLRGEPRLLEQDGLDAAAATREGRQLELT